MKEAYKFNDRVSFMARNIASVKGAAIVGPFKHHVGYIKAVYRGLFGTKYAICVSNSDEMHVVPAKHIFGKVERKQPKEINNLNND